MNIPFFLIIEKVENVSTKKPILILLIIVLEKVPSFGMSIIPVYASLLLT